MLPRPHWEPRVAALEVRVEEVAANAATTRQVADLATKVEANTQAINALGVQTAARFDQVDQRFEQMDGRFATIDRRFARIDQRFTAIDQRFTAIDQRFTAVDQRFDDLETKVDANRKVINALAEQTAGGFAEMRAKFDQTAAGFQTITDLLTTLIERDDK